MNLLAIERRERKEAKERNLRKRLKAGTATSKEYVAEIRRLLNVQKKINHILDVEAWKQGGDAE